MKESVSASGNLNAKLYSSFRKELNEFFRSEIHFFKNEVEVSNGLSVLDIGGGAGGLGHALKKVYGKLIEYTCIDPDEKAIEAGKKLFKSKFPDIELIKGFYPDGIEEGRKWDLVAVIGWFAQIPNWKETLLQCVENTIRYINIGINVRLEGNTVIDKDVSYVLYLDTGIRVYEITHNLWEILNFCSIPEMRAKKISFYGYTNPTKSSSAFRPLPRDKQIQGNLLIELLPEGAEIERYGGISNEALQSMIEIGEKIHVWRPEYNIIINDARIEISGDLLLPVQMGSEQ